MYARPAMQAVHIESEKTPIRLEREQIRFPLPLKRPRGFRLAEPSSWPHVEGRLEYVNGELLFMPPCADYQQDVAAEIIRLLGNWSVKHPSFLVAGNEAGMLLEGEARGADAAVWRKADVGPHRGVFRRVPPLLAVEVAGEDEAAAELRRKAAWYLGHGVATVWLVLPHERLVLSITSEGETRAKGRARLSAHGLAGLRPTAGSLFRQLER